MAFEPRLTLSETWTDNHDLGTLKPEGDLVSKLTAGLGWRAQTGVLRGYVDYALTGLVYARHSDRNELQNALNANITADLIDSRLQLVSAASIARSAISAFDVQPGGGGSAKLAEVRNLQVTPTWRAPLGRTMFYTATLDHVITETANSSVGDAVTTTASLHLEPSERARLGWALDASHLASDFKQGRPSQADRLYGGLSFEVTDHDLRLTSSLGAERSNFGTLDKSTTTTWGVGMQWTPSPATRVAASMEERFFGRSHALDIEHRTARTIFRLHSARTLSTSGNSVAGTRSSLFDLFVGQPGIVALFPDRAQRETYVNNLIRNDLNRDPNQIIDTGFLRSAATLQDVQSISAAWTGPRNTAVLQFSRTATRRADTLTSAVDDLSRVGVVRSNMLSLDLSHRLTPDATLNLLLSSQHSSSDLNDQSMRQTLADLQFSTRLARDRSLSLSLRRAHYNTGLRSYDETALTASVVARF